MGCFVCGSLNTEKHHIIYRSKCGALIKCKYNLVDLCNIHHRGTYGVHGKYGETLNFKLKKKFKEDLLVLFGVENYFFKREIASKLDITNPCVDRLLKILPYAETYKSEDIIRCCLGGRDID